MKKVIEKKLTISPNNRDVDRLYQEFYSKDKGIAEFKFTLDNLTATKVICLFYFKSTKRYQEVEAVIEENSFTVQFDTSLITTDEPVIGYIYFEKVEQSADVYSFLFNVHVSEIDKAVKTPLIERESGRIVNVKDVVTKQELDKLFAKIKEQGGTYDDSNLRTEISHISADIEALKQKPGNNTIYDDSVLKQRISALESKPDKDTIYNDSEIKNRLENLENKPSVDTSSLVTKQELESKGYLLQHQSLDGYAKKSEIPQPYNDTEIKQRLATVEQKGQDYATKEQLASIPKTPQKLSIEGNTLILSDGGGNVTLPVSTGPNNQVNQYEIHGQGMPNGKVVAPVGTTYVDTTVTNGALKWIKRVGVDNQGWEILTGDTGWKKLSISSGYNQATLRVRRVNNIVTYQFGGLKNDAFGVVRRGGPGYLSKQTDPERDVYILYTQRLPLGYRSVSSLSGPIFNVNGNLYGSWSIGGANNGNFLSLHFADPVPEDSNIDDIIVSTIMYVTNDPWPK